MGFATCDMQLFHENRAGRGVHVQFLWRQVSIVQGLARVQVMRIPIYLRSAVTMLHDLKNAGKDYDEIRFMSCLSMFDI